MEKLTLWGWEQLAKNNSYGVLKTFYNGCRQGECFRRFKLLEDYVLIVQDKLSRRADSTWEQILLWLWKYEGNFAMI